MKLPLKSVLASAFMLTASFGTNLHAERAENFILKPNPYPRTFTFALIGDLPYTIEQEQAYQNLLDDLNSDKKLSFVIHDGDFKGGSVLCDDAIYNERLESFNSLKHPLVYIFGDNEWTDCHRPAAGSYDPFERLELLRSLFANYNEPYSLGMEKLALQRQSRQFPENVRWTYDHVMFIGLHIPGSNNGLRTGAAFIEQAEAEYERRNTANLEWLHESFERAIEEDSPGIMITIQANPWDFIPADRLTGYEDFLVQLEHETRKFGKPVVLVHGDSHFFRIDKPLPSALPSDVIGTDFPFIMPWDSNEPRLENFTRVETFGNPNAYWVKVSVDRNNPNVFLFEEKFVEKNRSNLNQFNSSK
ncbi:MAG: metallophosphoesterase [Gammaproteobacteria bacterium]